MSKKQTMIIRNQVMRTSLRIIIVAVQKARGPRPMQEVVVRAVRKAVRAATMTFAAISIMRCFFMIVWIVVCA